MNNIFTRETVKEICSFIAKQQKYAMPLVPVKYQLAANIAFEAVRLIGKNC